MENLIGKTFELINIDGSIMIQFKIRYCKKEIIPSMIHSDGSVSAARERFYVSKNGAGWYGIYNNGYEKITK